MAYVLCTCPICDRLTPVDVPRLGNGILQVQCEQPGCANDFSLRYVDGRATVDPQLSAAQQPPSASYEAC